MIDGSVGGGSRPHEPIRAGPARARVDRGGRLPILVGVAAFKPTRYIRSGMRCHYCDRDAAFTAEKDGVRVGLCKSHFRERFQELADSDAFDDLREELDIDRT